jgi:glutathione S-transferase
MPADRIDEYHAKQQGGHQALSVMEQQLAKTDFLTGDQLTTADISLYAYTHVAHEGGFDLQPYQGLKRWLARIASYPGYIDMG